MELRDQLKKSICYINYCNFGNHSEFLEKALITEYRTPKLCFLMGALFALISTNNAVFGQTCEAETHYQEQLKDSIFAADRARIDDEVSRYVPPIGMGTTDIVVPIVVHIIHYNQAVGVGHNISDSVIHSAIAGLNDRFSGKINNGVDMHIRFKLAQQAPDGCATDGIDRIDANTLPGGTLITTAQQYRHWPVTEYLNIYVLSDSTINGAYAYYPTTIESFQDGIVMGNSKFIYGDNTLTHEMGHSLNLYHTWSSSCSNSDCTKDGDKVCDTAPQYQYDCAANPTCGDTAYWDNSRYNYMSYCPAWSLFTVGQRERMHATFTNTIRTGLLTSHAFDSTHLHHSKLLIQPLLCNDLITLSIKNFGWNDIDSINLVWEINGQLSGDTTLIQHLGKCESKNFIIPDTAAGELKLNGVFSVRTKSINGISDTTFNADTSFRNASIPSGTYQVGMNAPFKTVNDAVSYINENGICGSIIFEIEDGEYKEQIKFNKILKSDNSATIIFKGKKGSNSNVVLKNTEQPFIFWLDSTENLTFQNLIFRNDTIANLLNCFELSGIIKNLSFKNCLFQVDSNQNGNGIVKRQGSYLKISNLKVDSCAFQFLQYGINTSGSLSTDFYIRNCTFSDGVYGISIVGVSRSVIQNCTFRNFERQSIYLGTCYGPWYIGSNSFWDNKYSNIIINNFSGNLNQPITVVNNFFGGNYLSQGIVCTNAEFVSLLHNSFNGNHINFNAIRFATCQNMSIVNNLFYAKGGVCFLSDTLSTFIADYNNYYLDYRNPIFDTSAYYSVNVTFPQNIKKFQLSHGLETHATFYKPWYLNEYSPEHCNQNLGNTGADFTGVKNDYFGTNRDSKHPDIGAFEFDSDTTLNFLPDKQIACDTAQILPNLNQQKYTYLWNDSSTSNQKIVSKTEKLILRIQDTFCGSYFYDSVMAIISESKYKFKPIAISCDSNEFSLPTSFNGTNVLWNDNTKGGKIKVFSTTDIYFRFIDSLGCLSLSDTIPLKISRTPKVDLGADRTIKPGDVIFLNAGAFTDVRYLWSNFFDTQTIKLEADNLGIGSHPFSVLVENKDKCIGRDTINVIVTKSGGIKLNSTDVKIYPNPANNRLHISHNFNNSESMEIRIIDATGQVFCDKILLNHSGNEIDLSTLKPGLYILEIYGGRQQAAFRFQKL